MPQRARIALIGAASLVVLLLVTWYAAFHVGFVESLDRSILRGFGGIGEHPRVSSIAGRIARLCDPNPYVYFCAIPVIVALARRRVWVAVAIGAILLGANVTTQLLKPLLAEPRSSAGLPSFTSGPASASWPSGHATAAMSLALCAVLAASARYRPVVAALGAAFAVAVSYSFLSLEWHYPTDVLGGFLVAGIWTLVAAAAVYTVEAKRVPRARAAPAGAVGGTPGAAGGAAGATSTVAPRQPLREALGPPSAALIGALALALLVVIARPHAVVSYAHLHKAFVIGAIAIGALGLALATGVMLALRPGRRSDGRSPSAGEG